MHVVFPNACNNKQSETLKTPDHELIMCKKEHSAMLYSETCSTYIYLIKSQPLQVNNRTKSFCDFGFVSIHRAALLMGKKFGVAIVFCFITKH